MSRTKTMWCRQLLMLVCAIVIFSVFLTAHASADYVNVTTGTSYSYFQTFSSSGVWTGVGTPTHTIVQTGAPAYCLQTEYTSPSGGGYTTTDPWYYYDAATIYGLQAILEHGYPNDDGGYSEEEARYATANAIRFWLAERGAQGVPSWMNLTLYRQFFRAVPGYEELFDWCLYLLDCARNQEVYEHAVSFSSLNLVEDGDYYTGTTTVTLINCGGGYTIDKSGLPEGAIVDGYTGDTGDVLTIRIPTRYAGASYTLSATGIDNQTEASLIYYAPDNWNEQRVVTYVYNIEVKAAAASLEVRLPDKPKDGKLIIRKYDAETGEPIAGVSFGYGGSSGDQIAGAITDSTGTVIFTDIPAGEYFFQEISAPGLYIVDTTRRTFIIRAGEELNKIITFYGFADNESTNTVLSAIGLSASEAYSSENGVFYFTSDSINSALAAALAANSTTVKTALESHIKNAGGTAMNVTDEYGHSSADGLELGLYLIVETLVPENVTSTCNPFLISLPMTTLDGSSWNYDVTVYPKNKIGYPTLEKTVRESASDTGKNNGSTIDITDGYAHSASASTGDIVEYQFVSTLPTITSPASNLSCYTFVDNLPRGITYNRDDVVIYFYKDKECTELIDTWNMNSGKFTVSYSEQSSGQQMTVEITANGLSEINNSTKVYSHESLYRGYSDCTMRVCYSCIINSDASFIYGGSGNTNSVTLTWKRTNSEYYDTLTDDAHVFSYVIDLLKKFSDGAGKLSNVKFKLYNDTDGYYVQAKLVDSVYYVTGHIKEDSQATEFVPAADGHIVIKGLEDDSYILTELATDTGYNLLKDKVKIVISVSDGAECARCHKPLLTASAKVNNKNVDMLADGSSASAVVPLTVVNTKGFTLPKTGSYGTWMFTVGGILAMGIAVIIILSLSKKKRT